MKLFKICAVFMVVTLLLSSLCAGAVAGTIDVNIDNATFDVTVSGNFDNSLRNRASVVIAEGKITAQEYAAYTPQEKLIKTKYVRQRSFDSEKYTFSCGSDFERLTCYTAIVNYDGLTTPLVKSFYYYKLEDMDAIVKEFNRVLALGAADMKGFINSNTDGFFYDFENYISLSDSERAEVSGIVINYDAVSSISEIKAVVEKEALTYIICDMLNDNKYTEADAKVLENLALLRLDTYAETTTYKDADDDFRLSVLKYLKGMDVDGFTGNFREQVVLTQIEKVDNSERITNILKSMSESMDVDISKYTSYSKKSKVNSYIAGNKYSSVDDLMDVINEYIDDSGKTGNNNGSLGTTGNSRPSGGGISSVKIGNTSSPAVVVPEITVFSDVPAAHWAYTAISALKNDGIVSGYGDNTFAPDNNITRAEFVKMAISAFELMDSSAVADFKDVNQADWSYKYIASAQKYGIVNGDGNGSFLPNSPIIREEAAAIIYRIAVFKGYAFEAGGDSLEFVDFDNIADYAKTAVSSLKRYGILSGSEGKFNPKDAASRAEIAQMIYNLMKNLLLN